MNPSYFAAVSHRNHMTPPYFVDVSLAIGPRRGLRIYTKSQPFPHLSVEGHGTHTAVVSLGVHQVTHSQTDYLYIYMHMYTIAPHLQIHKHTHTDVYIYIYIIYIYIYVACSSLYMNSRVLLPLF